MRVYKNQGGPVAPIAHPLRPPLTRSAQARHNPISDETCASTTQSLVACLGQRGGTVSQHEHGPIRVKRRLGTLRMSTSTSPSPKPHPRLLSHYLSHAPL
jgi:hypothetical protein